MHYNHTRWLELDIFFLYQKIIDQLKSPNYRSHFIFVTQLRIKLIKGSKCHMYEQLTFVFFGWNWHHISLLGLYLLMTLTARAINLRWRATEIIQPIIQSQNHATNYLWPRGHAHTCIYIGIKVISRHQECAGLCLLVKNSTLIVFCNSAM